MEKVVPELGPVLRFLDRLERNNNRTWFQSNRTSYEEARQLFREFIRELLRRLEELDPLEGVTPGECIFRLHRDVRFSQNKQPYKTNFAAVLSPDGRKTTQAPYYIQLAPHQGSFLGGGFYAPSSATLRQLRQSIDDDPQPFHKVLGSAAFGQHFGSLQGEQLKTAPQGYSKDHPQIELLRRKQWLATRRFSDEQVVAETFVEEVIDSFRALQPFLDLLNGAVRGGSAGVS